MPSPNDNLQRLAITDTPDKETFGYYDATVDGGWQVPGEPYTEAEGTEFLWWRSRMLGGRTNHFGRYVPRFNDRDFKPATHDGLGVDWPLDYEDVAPYYDKVEALIGVFGTNEGLENTPDSLNGTLMPPPKARAAELLARKHGKKIGIPIVPIWISMGSRKRAAMASMARLAPRI